jgi:hypothetical protein
MRYNDLIELYFERSNSLQWYWTIYVVVIGGLLAFSSLRQRPDPRTGILVTVLFCFFAYKNLGAIRDVSFQRFAIHDTIKSFAAASLEPAEAKLREAVEPTLVPPAYPGVRNFHIASDILTVAALWAMERRRMRARDSLAAADQLRDVRNTPAARALLPDE